jgi:hypothetical protein
MKEYTPETYLDKIVYNTRYNHWDNKRLSFTFNDDGTITICLPLGEMAHIHLDAVAEKLTREEPYLEVVELWTVGNCCIHVQMAYSRAVQFCNKYDLYHKLADALREEINNLYKQRNEMLYGSEETSKPMTSMGDAMAKAMRKAEEGGRVLLGLVNDEGDPEDMMPQECDPLDDFDY